MGDKPEGGMASNMTLRDYFAGQAFLNIPITMCPDGERLNAAKTAKNAYKMANAMIKERKE